jgi:hypothetical protein
MTTEEAVAALDAINVLPEGERTWQDGDPETFHIDADQILLDTVDPQVKAAYLALIDRCGWWAHA